MSRVARAFRSETYTRLANYTTDTTEPLTFTSPIVSGEYTNKEQWQHLLKVAWEDPIGHRICVLLPTNVFDDWFVIKKKVADTEEDTLEELEEHPDNAQIQEEFVRMNAKYHLTQALIAEHIFGRSFVVYNKNLSRDDFSSGYQVATLDVFTEENVEIPVEAYNITTGEPDYILVYPNPNTKTPEKIPWGDLTLWCTRPKGRSVEGYSAMYPVWDYMVYLRESIEAAVWTHKKYGLGVWMWYIKGALSAELKASAEDTLQKMSAKRAVIVETDVVDRVEWSGPPQGGTTSIIEGAEFLLGQISSGSGVPKDIYTGVSAGAITGSEINNKALYATINKKQSDVTPFVLDCITRMGYEVADMVIEWNTRYATDELEQAQVRQMNADALIKEKQAERGDDFMINVQSNMQQGSPKDPNKTNNPAGVRS